MTDRPTSTRLPPVEQSQWTPSARELLAGVSDGDQVPNIFATLIRAEGLLRKWLPFGGKLLNGKIPIRDRELLVLRTGWNCRAEYEWAQHVAIGLKVGLTRDEIDKVATGPAADWDEFDAALLRAADELNSNFCLSDETWSALADRYNEQQMIEVLMLVGQYTMIAMTLNSLGVPLDSDIELSGRVLHGGDR